MLEPLRHVLQTTRIVLASGSPRRKEILANANLPNFRIVPSDAEENLDRSQYRQQPWKFAEDTAKLKAEEVFQRLCSGWSSQNEDKVSADADAGDDLPFVVIGADTVVTQEGGEIFGKPKSDRDAADMLSRFSGQRHVVYTGVHLMAARKGKCDESPKTTVRTFHVATTVHFAELSEATILGYIATREPMDKAGSYGIQGIGGTLVEKIEGDYYNVVGFPLHRFCKEIQPILEWTKQE